MRSRILTGLAVMAAALFCSCESILDNLDDCPPLLEPLRLLVTTDHEEMEKTRAVVIDSIGMRTTRTPIQDWYNTIENVVVYVFDGEYNFVKHWEGGAYTLGKTYEVPLDALDLPDGTYNFVVWTNHGEDHELYNSNLGDLIPLAGAVTGDAPHHDDLVIEMNVPASREFLEDLAHRHYGALERVELSDAATVRTNTVVIAPNTHKVNFMVEWEAKEGYGGYTEKDGLRVNITDRNVEHDFDNKVIPGGAYYSHIRTLKALPAAATRADAEEAPALGASMVVMQLQDDTGTSFDVKVKGADDRDVSLIGGAIDLVRIIRTAALASGDAVDFDYSREFDITMRLPGRQIDPGTTPDPPINPPTGPDTGSIVIDFVINGWTYRYNRTQL